MCVCVCVRARDAFVRSEHSSQEMAASILTQLSSNISDVLTYKKSKTISQNTAYAATALVFSGHVKRDALQAGEDAVFRFRQFQRPIRE